MLTAADVALPTIDILQFAQFGFVGIVLACLMIPKFLVPEWTLKRAEERHSADRSEMATRHAEDRAELLRRLDDTREQLDRLQGIFEREMIPALTKVMDMSTHYEDELRLARSIAESGKGQQ